MKQITPEILAALSNKENPVFLAGLAAGMNEFFPKYGINTDLRLEHFLCQALHEADGFRTLQEYASGDAYDTRTDLGNTAAKDGDGRLYKGRGIFQTTGRANYAAAGKAMGLDLIAHPELLAQPRNAVWSACIYWQSRKLNDYADKDDIFTITKRINGGTNGLDSRKAYLRVVKAVLKV
jgi:putative chitinase